MDKIDQTDMVWVDQYIYLGDVVLEVSNPQMSPCIHETIIIDGSYTEVESIEHNQIECKSKIYLD